MLTNYTINCRPIRIVEEDSMTGSRIGGNPPEGIEPTKVFDCTKYFSTIVTDEEEGKEISLFNSFEKEIYSERSFLNNRDIIYPHDQVSFVQFVVHETSSRKKRKSDLTSVLASKALNVLPEEPDPRGWLDAHTYYGTKMGGLPLYWKDKESLRGQGQTLLDQGFTHLLQFAFPTYRDFPISGSWPYAPYVFHMFVDDPKQPKDIRYGWG